MVDPSTLPPIIIKKRKKGGAAHHGGAWKVAYADFVTAMMAFFLLLWLLNVTTDVQRHGIADYFTPASISETRSGAGGIFGGLTITAPGAQISRAAPPGVATAPARRDEDAEDQENSPSPPNSPNTQGNTDKKDNGTSDQKEKGASDQPGNSTADATGQAQGDQGSAIPLADAKPKSAAESEAAKREEQSFKNAEQTLRQEISQVPELKGLSDNITIDQTPEGLRIQIVDKENYSMFPRGGAELLAKSRELLELVGRVISKLPNKVAITGHTDSTPFVGGGVRDNWTLSTERANVSRRALMGSGVDENRIARVVGMADREPLLPNDTTSSQNRRIGILLLRKIR